VTSPSTLADRQRERGRLLAASVADRMQERWAQLDPVDLDASWTRLLPGTQEIVAAGQMLAAAYAEDYLTASVGAANLAVNPAGFTGQAADGRSLATLLQEPVVAVKTALLAGQPLDEALGRGLVRLTMSATTEVADAGRTATGAGITARPKIYGHVRIVNPPACGRCVVLADRVYRWSEGFQRHPRCDCGMGLANSSEAEAARSPEELFRSMDSSEQEKAFTVAGAKAIRDGADIGRVVNAQRGMYEAGGRSLTTEATTRRGRLPGQRAGARLTPKQIYAEAGDDRAEAVRLFRRFGYLT
jgi:hypothetical protein